MLDAIWVPPAVHIWSGMIVLLATFAAMVITTLQAWRKRKLGGGGNAVRIADQLALIVQAVIGIKLLDQGLGLLQLFIK